MTEHTNTVNAQISKEKCRIKNTMIAQKDEKTQLKPKQDKTFYLLVSLTLAVVILFWPAIFRPLLIPQDKTVHYHANFHLYIQGERELFESVLFYEETSACSANSQKTPKSRVHMHDNKAHLIHIHDQAVTYSHFFGNLGFALTDKVLQTHTQVYNHKQQGELRFILNGKQVQTLANRVIKNQDVVLIDFGNDPLDVLQERYRQIEVDAAQANNQQDPASCLGGGEASLSWYQRILQSWGL